MKSKLDCVDTLISAKSFYVTCPNYCTPHDPYHGLLWYILILDILASYLILEMPNIFCIIHKS